ncbi:hypothetical protein OQ640_31035, partial [Klebsiella pneumoniae]|nr:hypothetical protein [Klebsiella pneumoniae]
MQVFELIYGGSKLDLQELQCLANLTQLSESGLLEPEAVADLE